jgi:hypothetical protein
MPISIERGCAQRKEPVIARTTDNESRELLGSFQRQLFFPRYCPGEVGAWTLQVVPMLAARGYWGQVYSLHGAVILKGPSARGAEAWMAMLPSEIESQEVGLSGASGHTLVFGLGMGWLAANAALRPEVQRVSVVERDPEIIALARATGVFEQLPEPAQRKIQIIQGDALEWVPSDPVDSMQADIWLTLAEEGKLAAVRRMQRNVGARRIYFWGQEMEIWRHACRHIGGIPETLDWATLRDIVETDLQLPLILPDWPDYPEKIAAAARWWTPARDGWWRMD